MCERIKDINGDSFPHWHNEYNQEIFFKVPEFPDERDVECIKECFPGYKLVFGLIGGVSNPSKRNIWVLKNK